MSPMPIDFEQRTSHGLGIEIRSQSDGVLRLTGYASLTGVEYQVRDYLETIAPGAFKETLARHPDVQLLVNHGGLALARTKSGTLRLSEDDRGLNVDADLDAQDPDVQALAGKMRRRDVDQMSFAFQPLDSEWSDDFKRRLITRVELHRGDVSVCNQGASPTTSASVRAAAMAAAGCGHHAERPLVSRTQLAREQFALLRAARTWAP